MMRDSDESGTRIPSEKYSGVMVVIIVLIFFALCICVIGVGGVWSRISSINQEIENRHHFYKVYVGSGDNNNDIARGVLRSDYEVIFGEDNDVFKTYHTEDSSQVMISKFNEDNKDYQCLGNCFCDDIDDDERKSISSMKSFTRRVGYFLSVSSSIIAMKRASEYFEDRCKHDLKGICSSDGHIFSEIDSCDLLQSTNRVEEEEQEESEEENYENQPIPKHSVLFICHGNVCRSPMCHCIFEKMEKQRDWTVDSCGVSDGFAGRFSDPRTMRILKRHFGRRKDELQFRKLARGIVPEDFVNFEYIICMDDKNLKDCVDMLEKLEFGPEERTAKIQKLTHYSDKHEEIKDPFKDGPTVFENVFQICTECCEEFLEQVEGKDRRGSI